MNEWRSLSAVSKRCPDLQVNSVSAREQLAQSIRDLTAALAERHASLTQALEVTRQKRGEALAAQVGERRSLMEHAGLLAFTQELLKETDQPCFVQAARHIHNRFLCFFFFSPPFPVSLFSISIKYWSEHESVLMSALRWNVSGFVHRRVSQQFCVMVNNSQKVSVAANLQGTAGDSESAKIKKENGWKAAKICCLRAALLRF